MNEHHFTGMTCSRLRPLLPLGLCLLLFACSETPPGEALGTLERDRYILTATAAEVIVSQPVAEGTRVDAGDLVVQLDTSLQATAVARAEAELRQVQAAFDRLSNGFRPEEIEAARSRVQAARAAFLDSEREVTRLTGLVERKLVAEARLDTARSVLDVNQATLDEAEENLSLILAGTREEEIREALARIDSASASLEAERKRLQDLTLNAPVSGTLDSLLYESGERVQAGARLAILIEDSPPFARVYIPETRLAGLSVGMSFEIKVDGSDSSYTGTLEWLASEPAFTPYYALNQEERSRLVYLAEVRLDESATALPTGLPVQVLLP